MLNSITYIFSHWKKKKKDLEFEASVITHLQDNSFSRYFTGLSKDSDFQHLEHACDGEG